MPIGPLRDLEAEASPRKILAKPLMLAVMMEKAFSVPTGMASARLYSLIE
jgi:hypothetical protein